jgi:hypothetical protein
MRNSGELNLNMSVSIDAWSNQRMSKEELNETVRSDEFLKSKLYTNTQKLQVIDIVDSSMSKYISGNNSGSNSKRDGQGGYGSVVN